MDHPRRCGENLIIRLYTCTYAGSPPQVRGKLCAAHCRLCGNMDHPRRCGENSEITICPFGHKGSPPQVRGKPVSHLSIFPGFRITPAGAGKTRQPFVHFPGVQDHPRRCGENLLKSQAVCLDGGSPPQVRGKQVAQCSQPHQTGITPAGAGKTPFPLLTYNLK